MGVCFGDMSFLNDVFYPDVNLSGFAENAAQKFVSCE